MPSPRAARPAAPAVALVAAVVSLLTGLTLVLTGVSSAAAADDDVIPAGKGPALGFAKVDAGGEYTCGIKDDGTLWCWGRNTWGQVGTGDRDDVSTPTQVGSADDWKQVSAGGATTCGIRGRGVLYCWGLNNRGQLGDRSKVVRERPHRVPGRGAWERVSAGWYNVCGIRRGGTAQCWGDNTSGQLGRGSTKATLKRVTVRGGSSWRSISVGGWFACGIRQDRSLWCWGRNMFGQVGDGSYTPRSAPVRVGSGRRWAEVSTSWTHSCARSVAGDVLCWGRNGRGAVGDGTIDATTRPQPVAGDHTAVSVTAFEGGSCLVDRRDRAWCWGDNMYGQVGGTAPTVLRPRLHGRGFESVDGGWMHVCGERPGDRVSCWGNNERGALGGRHRGSRTTPWDAGRRPAPEPAAAGRGLQLRIATFNVLGEHHTGPYRDADRYAPSRIRAEWTAQAIMNNGLDVVGVQEASLGQVTAIQRASGGRLDAFPGAGDRLSTETTLMWDKRRFEAVREKTLLVRFIDRKLRRPQVLLRDKQTGRTFWVLAVHNAPNTKQAARNQAVATQIKRIKRLEQGAAPVFFIGDLNEKETVFCKVLRQTDLVSPAGGRLTRSGRCIPPRSMRVDWIFGPRNGVYSRFSNARPALVALTTDHHVPMSSVRVP